MTRADICIICEGSYPYHLGGVSEWVHQLIQAQAGYTFHVLSIVLPHSDLTMRYTFPSNVIGHTNYAIQELPKGSFAYNTPDQTWDIIESAIQGMINSPQFDAFAPLITLFKKERRRLGSRILSESKSAWNTLLKLYGKEIPSAPFKAYFGTIHTLTLSLFSMLSPPLPNAKLFHSVCTGYAGFLLYRAKQELSVPCILTEHGIYSNERRIEIALSDWITDKNALNLTLDAKKRTLKDFWLNAFFSFAYACYKNSDAILTTFDGHQQVQIEGGADPKKIRTIVHGIDLKNRKPIKTKPHSKTVAFIGRVVPIKDVKTFIRAAQLVLEKMPECNFYLLGPVEEDPEYVIECQTLIDSLDLKEHLVIQGAVNLKDYFPTIDLIVQTSISEAQPLILLEAGALGIPCVATDVGACQQIIYGAKEEEPPLGNGGIITLLVNPRSTADAIIQLLSDKKLYERCSRAIAKRINTYYKFEDEQAEYSKLYTHYLKRD